MVSNGPGMCFVWLALRHLKADCIWSYHAPTRVSYGFALFV